MISAAPCLILLDCQRDQVERPEGGIDPENRDVIKRIARLLQQARMDGWPVFHCQYAGEQPAAARTPIDALRPNAREPVFVRRGLSAFTDSYFHQVLARNAGRTCLLVGFSAPFSVLATVFDAQTRDHELNVVPEAVGTLAVAPRTVGETRAMAFDLIGRLSPTTDWDSVSQAWLRAPVQAE
ncbi:isochorismatase family protein [Maricaulis sp.]|uniref:isochorismatase family protein n=1 Tax=Maricaulis sp. TaxID=1486257 RepID=UPI0026350083|nr:isochorismatase family protein [Maricaulis sp.]